MTNTDKKNLQNECMKLWTEIVKLRAKNVCEYCSRSNNLNAHHFYSRSNVKVKYDLDNGFCLCSGCHSLSSSFSAHKTPAEFVEWAKSKRGQLWFDRLQLKANYYGGQKTDISLELLYLKQELKRYCSSDHLGCLTPDV